MKKLIIITLCWLLLPGLFASIFANPTVQADDERVMMARVVVVHPRHHGHVVVTRRPAVGMCVAVPVPVP